MWLRTIAAWLLFLVAAIVNGAFRVNVLIPRLGDHRAHIVSTLILATVIVIGAAPIVQWIGVDHAADAMAVGTLWLGCTLTFEFLAGHYLFGNSWQHLLADYDLRHGRIWLLVLIATLLAPLCSLAWRHHS
jgi:hypothetical protein